MKFLNLKTYLKSTYIPILIFIAYGLLGTQKFWEFNSSFTIEISILGWPLENAVFLVLFSYISMFLWKNFSETFESRNKVIKFSRKLIPFLILVLVGLASITNTLYTWSMLIFFLVIYLLDVYHYETSLIYQKIFLIFILLIIPIPFILDLVLLSKHFIIYYSQYKTNINILEVPIENILYGINFIYLCCIFYNYNQAYDHK